MRNANWIDVAMLLLDFCERYRVEGDSMLPTLTHGDEVSVKKPTNLAVGDIVVAYHPFRKKPIVKRIKEISTGGKFFLAGDNPSESTDSRTLGEFDKKDILGKVICRLR